MNVENETLPPEQNDPAVVKYHGPWIADESSTNAIDILTGGGRIVAVVVTVDDSDVADEDRANARLIAAAPDMLAMLQEIAPEWDGTDSEFGARVRAVIAKATGAI